MDTANKRTKARKTMKSGIKIQYTDINSEGILTYWSNQYRFVTGKRDVRKHTSHSYLLLPTRRLTSIVRFVKYWYNIAISFAWSSCTRIRCIYMFSALLVIQKGLTNGSFLESRINLLESRLTGQFDWSSFSDHPMIY